MSKIFSKYAFIIAAFFTTVQIFLTVSDYLNIEQDKNDLFKIDDIKKVLLDLKFNRKDYKAIAGVIDDSYTYAYGYSSNHRTQDSANKKALFLCEKYRKRFSIKKECMLINDLMDKYK